MSFEYLKTIYRDFDIRGLYPDEITDDEVYKIAKALTVHFKPKRVAIARDNRPSGLNLLHALTQGFIEMGVDVIDYELCTTPMTYFICGNANVDMAIMITASHMPSQFNGLKISVGDAKPVTHDILLIIRNLVQKKQFVHASMPGTVTTQNCKVEWNNFFKQCFNFSQSQFTVVVDPANMIGICEIDTLKIFAPNLTIHAIFDTYDHTCPHHEANPIKHETLTALGEEVRRKKANIGVAFDGDADRVGFVDENGIPVSSDIIGILLSRYILQISPHATIVADTRSTKALEREVERLGGNVVREKVGHTHIRTRMRNENAALGVELAGHFFFKETHFSEGGPMPIFMILSLMQQEQKTLSELASEVTLFSQSGEINSSIQDTPSAIYERIVQHFPMARVEWNDGITIHEDTWWANIRPSANDPVLRLNVEAQSPNEMKNARDILLQIIRS